MIVAAAGDAEKRHETRGETSSEERHQQGRPNNNA